MKPASLSHSEPAAGPWVIFSIGRFHIVAIAALAAFTFGWLFSGRHVLWLAAVVALDWYLVNLLNRVVDLREDQINGIAGTAFVARRQRPITWIGGAILVASFPVIHWFAPALTPWRLGYHALGLAYNYPLLPTRARRLKATYGLKNVASAGGFMITVFAYPLAALAPDRVFGPAAAGVAALALFFFCFELAYEVVYDLRDVRGDASEGVPTFPVIHGIAWACRLIDGLLATSVAVLVGAYLVGVVGWREVVMAVAPVFLFVFYRARLPRGITSADCISATAVGAGMLLAYNAWIMAGLPLDLPRWGF